MIDEHDLKKVISVDSAGTYSQHTGHRPDKRASAAAEKRGYDLSKLRARKVKSSDFENFDYILAMDDENYADLIAQCDEVEYKVKVRRFLEFATKAKVLEVPDPYYGGAHGFETVLDLVEDASLGLLEHIRVNHLPKSTG